jgi:hypothetical protein
MKHKEITFLLVILIGFSSLLVLVNTNPRKTRFSSSNRFLVHFLRGLGLKVNSRGLARIIRRKCKKFSRSSFIRSLSIRIVKLGRGLKKINSMKSGASRKKRRFYLRIARVHTVSLFRDVFSGLSRCGAIPRITRSYIRKAIKTMKRIMWGKCRSKKERRGCRVFSGGRVSRLFGRIRALLRLSRRRFTFSRKSSKKNRRRRSVRRRRNTRRSKGKKNKKSRGSNKNLTGRESFYYIANSFARLLKRFIRRLGSKLYKKWKKSLKKASKKMRKIVKKIMKKLRKKNKGKKSKGKPKFVMAMIEKKEAIPISPPITPHKEEKSQVINTNQNQVQSALKA